MGFWGSGLQEAVWKTNVETPEIHDPRGQIRKKISFTQWFEVLEKSAPYLHNSY
jgi:hypothetical protein